MALEGRGAVVNTCTCTLTNVDFNLKTLAEVIERLELEHIRQSVSEALVEAYLCERPVCILSHPLFPARYVFYYY